MVRDFQAWGWKARLPKGGEGGVGEGGVRERRKTNPRPALSQFLRGACPFCRPQCLLLQR